MDLEPYFGGIVSAAIFMIGGWITVKGSYERRFATIETKLAAQDERIQHALKEAQISRELTIQIATLSAKLDDLAEDVRRHNGVVERMVVIEQQQQTMWKRQDELRDSIKEVNSGAGA